MNLFENLQLMKESDTSIVSEFKEFLASKNAQYIANEIGETAGGMQVVIYDGDWKHEHRYMQNLINEFFKNKGIDIAIYSEQIGESDSDTYSASYDIEFNAKPNTYTADVKNLKFTTEDAFPNDWKQRFKGMDIYVSDKYPEYQINKQYTSTEQEVWSVLDFKTQREVFASGTFEDAVKWIENKNNLKESTEFDSFQIGEEYEWSGLYGGSYSGVVKNIDEDSITLDVSWTAEDTGKLITKELTYDLETDSEGNVAFIVWRYSGEKGYIYPKNMSITESVENDINLDDYEYVGYGSGHNRLWQLYRRFDKELNKGVWVAKHQNTGEIRSITYDQAQGFEPIEDSGISRLSRDLGRMLLPRQESLNDSEWEYIEETTTKDDIFGDIVEGAHYIKQYNDNMIGYIYPPSKSEKLYRGKLVSKNHAKSLGYNAFIELDSAKEFLDETARKLTPVTYEDIKHQLEEIDTHEYLKIYIDEPISSDDVAITATIEGTLINDEPITFYDSSYIRTQGDINFIKEQYAKASKQIDAMRKRGYLGVKDEAVYGGAFDIADDQFFTRDDLTEFSNELEDIFVTKYNLTVSVNESYIDNNVLDVTISYGDYEYTHKEKIDMRKIKKPSDLITRYVNKFVSELYEQIKKDWNDESLVEVIESNEEDYNDNAATFLDTLEKEVNEVAHKFMLSAGFPEDEADDYLSVSTDITDEYIKIVVCAELGYDSLFNLCQTLDKVLAKYDKDAYFEPECPGRIVAYLFGEQVKKIHKENEQALNDKINSLDKVEETNHNDILDRDYATGEKLYNALRDYLNSLDQIAMNGEDCNWQPSEFNAKNLNADGEIYLVSGAYILIYPYVNEWAEDYFKVFVVEADELNNQIKIGIEDTFNKVKSNNWKLVFED